MTGGRPSANGNPASIGAVGAAEGRGAGGGVRIGAGEPGGGVRGASAGESAGPSGPPPVVAGLPRTAWLAIDLDRLAGNVAAIRAALPPGVRLEAVVKADAYGHGAVPVARALVAAGVDGLCVATFDEAAQLRAGGIANPLLVLFPIPPELAPEAARLELSVTASDPVLLRRTLATVAGAYTEGHIERPLSIHLEIETGLGRCGLSLDEAPGAAAAIAQTPGVRWAGIWSHLAAAGDAQTTEAQDERFGGAARFLAAEGGHLPARHLGASGALLASSAPSYDAVRIGLSLYGFVPDGLAVPEANASLAAALRPILSLRARPIRVTELPAGTGISYGPSFVTSRQTRVATLPVGYGDGYPRSHSNKGQALVRGVRVPLIGTVAMDAVMVDVTDVPGELVSVDDEFVLLGEQGDDRIEARDLAQQRNTISYEVVTSMSRRLPRVYYAAAEAVGLRTLTEERGEWPASSSGMGTSATSRSTSSSMPRT